jgi:ABC-type multidrug transport system ATPase subunit
MIRLNDIKVEVKNRTILDIPELELAKGKRYGVIGENGSGKTTLLRIIAGTLISNDGQLKGLPSKGEMGYLPQSPYAFSLSVLENVKMAIPVENSEQIAKTALEKVGMGALLKSRGNRLSGGERQRMGLARVLALPRSLLILDEPSSATDIRGTNLIEALLLDWHRESQGTLIFSTHSPAQVVRLADEVLFMDKGRVIERGSPREIFDSPVNEETRSFLSHWKL